MSEENFKELENRAKAYQSLLQDEGYGAKDPKWDDDAKTWDLVVKYEGMSFLVVFDIEDSDFVRIVLPNFFDVSESDLGNALMAADATNKKCKGVKIHLNSATNDSMATIEFLHNGDMQKKTLLRYFSMIMNGAKFYGRTIQNLIDGK